MSIAPLTALSLKAEMLATGDVPANRQPHYLQTRKKLEHDPKQPEWLLTVHGVGYRLRDN